METTLVLSSDLADELTASLRSRDETAGVLLARPVEATDGILRLLGREMVWVPDRAYAVRRPGALSITSDGYVPALRRAEVTQTVPIWMHTHPGRSSSPRPSNHDRVVNRQLAELFRLRAGTPYYVSLILSQDNGQLRFSGQVSTEEHAGRLQRLWIVGPRFALHHDVRQDTAVLSDRFDRNIRAFGGTVQHVLNDLTVGIVGCGGTGSAIAEQLVRLGVCKFVLLDPDELSLSNVTRVYGSTVADVGRAKVDVLAEHLQRVVPVAEVERIPAMLTMEAAARRLTNVDMIFGCTDDNAGRLILSRIATYLLTPVIDCGVLLSSDADGKVSGIDGRVTVMTPGAACLNCRGRIDLARAATELLTPAERVRRVEEGYAPALLGVEPAVVPYTTAVAAAAVNELLERLVGYGAEPVPSEVLLRIHERSTSSNIASPREGHYCHPDQFKIGAGAGDPFLDQTWAS